MKIEFATTPTEKGLEAVKAIIPNIPHNLRQQEWFFGLEFFIQDLVYALI